MKLVSNKWKVNGRHLASVVLLCDSISLRFSCVTMVMVKVEESLVVYSCIVVDLTDLRVVIMVTNFKF